jgi:hypothetical protein
VLGLEHDPEKWEPVFGKDHAQAAVADLGRVKFEIGVPISVADILRGSLRPHFG